MMKKLGWPLIVSVAVVAVVLATNVAAYSYGLSQTPGQQQDSLRDCLARAGLTENDEGNIEITADDARVTSEACIEEFLTEIDSAVSTNKREAQATAFLSEFSKCMSGRDYHVSLEKLPFTATDSQAYGSGSTEIKFGIGEEQRSSFKADYAACVERGEKAEAASAGD